MRQSVRITPDEFVMVSPTGKTPGRKMLEDGDYFDLDHCVITVVDGNTLLIEEDGKVPLAVDSEFWHRVPKAT